MTSKDPKRIQKYRDTIGIPINDCGEAMVVLQDLAPEMICEYEKFDMLPYTGQIMHLRSEVCRRLRKVAAELDSLYAGAKLRVVYAYRHPEIQIKYHQKRHAEVKAKFPELNAEELNELVNDFVASIEVAGHPTGAAVDLTIWTPDKGILDMGTKIADFSDPDRIKTFYPDLPTEVISNRMLLHKLMVNQGFAPFNGEWWHFSYGDREWAGFYEKPFAIYGQVDICST